MKSNLSGWGGACAASFACSMFVWQLLYPLYSAAQGRPGSTAPAPAASVGMGGAVDLGSSQVNQAAPNNSPVTIRVGGSVHNGVVNGGTSLTILPGQAITAAALAAVQSVITTGHQCLLLSNQGTAYGGFVGISQSLINGANGLTVPTGVTAYTIGSTAAHPLTIDGASVLNGAFYALQSQPNLVSTLQFGNLTIGSSGTLSGHLPSSLGFLSGVYSSGGLNLNITNNFLNQGIVSTPGNLSINAGGSITNQSVSGALANITASSASLFSSIGQIVNSGVIAATAGNLNLASAASSNLIVNNLGGVLRATESINFRDVLFNSNTNTSIVGGDVLSKELNIFGGQGAVSAQVENLTGVVNSSACTISVSASTPNLIFGNINATGDPLLQNTAGDVTISGSFGAGGNTSVIASGDVLASAGSSLTLTGAGDDLFVVAGANIQGSGPYIITGPKSPTGGKIDLTGMTSISTVGGDIVMAAYDGGNVDSGRVIIPGAPITTKGGNVTLIGADRNAVAINAIDIKSIDTSGGGAHLGNITLRAADLPSNINIVVDAAGNATGVNQISGFNGAPLPRNINVTGSLIADGAAINLVAGDGTANGNIFIGGQVSNNASAGQAGSFTVFQNSANPFVVGGATVNGIVGLPSNTNAILLLPGAAGAGGSLSITNQGTGGITVNNMNTNIQGKATSGNGASYTFSALATPSSGGPITFNGGGTLDASAAGTGIGGNITINSGTFTNAGGLSTFKADGANTGKGGSIQITSLASTNDIVVGTTSPAISLSAQGGAGGGDGGSIQVQAGRNLTVDVNAAKAGPQAANGAGGNYSFEAGVGGSGNLVVTGNLSANGIGTGAGGQISLTSNSSTTFSVTGATNGTTGTLSARGGASGGDGGGISIVNKGTGGITISNSTFVNVSPQAAGNGGNLTIKSTTGAITLAPGNYSATAGGGNSKGGTVDIEGTDVAISANAPVVLFADATGTGAGGSVTLKSTGAGKNILIDSSVASKNFQISARGGSTGSASGDGGAITVYAGGNLTVTASSKFDASPAGNNGNGAKYDLEAGINGSGNLLVNKSIDANAKGVGNGGNVTLITNTSGATPFVIGTSATTVGVNGTASALGGTTGNAGSVTVRNLGDSGIKLDLTSNVDVHASNGNAGSIILDAAATKGKEGNIIIPGGTLDVSATAGAASSGGTVLIQGKDWVTSGTGILNIVANGFGSGSGGSASFATTSSGSNLTVGSLGGTVTPSLNMSAHSGASGGNGGSIAVKAGGNLTVNNDPSNFDANPKGTNGNGQSLTLVAGNNGNSGDLYVDTSLSSKGVGSGNGGTIHLETSSAATFNLGAGSVSPGVNGTLDASAGPTSGNGGTVFVQNHGAGGVNIGTTTNINVAASAGAAGGDGGNITLDAGGGTLTIPLTAAPGGATLNAGATGAGTKNGGTITLNANTFTMPNSGQTLTLDVHGIGGGNAGTVTTTQGSGPINFDGTAGNFRIDGRSGDGAVITITTPGKLTYDPAANPYLPLDPNGDGARLTLTSTTGDLYVNGSLDASGVGTGAGGLISLSSNSQANTPFTIAPGATLNGVNGTLKANGGPLGGNAGTIQVFDHAANGGSAASKGIIVGDTSNISAIGFQGNGGSIVLKADNRTVEFQSTKGGTSLDASATGGNFSGGSIDVTGTRIDSNTIKGLTFNANGSGTGSGGAIHLTATDSSIGSITLGTGSGEVQLNAKSGTGSTANGGSITVDAAVDITGSSASLNVDSLATADGNGGAIRLHAGQSGNGHIRIAGDVSADGKGKGNGGLVEISSPFNNNFTLGSATGLDYISGKISAKAPLTGTGGTVNIINTRSGAPLNVDFTLTGLIDAGSAQGLFGNVDLLVNGARGSTPNPIAGESVTVTSVAGGGQINGFITTFGTDVAIKTDAPNARVDIGEIRTNFAAAKVGTINIDSSNGQGIVSIGEGHQLIAKDNVNITTEIFIDNTTIFQSQKNDGQIVIQSPTGSDLFVRGEGYLTLTGTGSGNLIKFAVPTTKTLHVENNLTLQPNDDKSTIQYLAGANGTVVIQAGRTQLINDGAEVQVSTTTFEMGAGSSITANPPGGRTTSITVDTGSSNTDLTVKLDGDASLVAGGANTPTINIGPTAGTADGKNLTFQNNSGGNATLSLLGGDVTTHISSTTSKSVETIQKNLTLKSDHSILMTADQSAGATQISEIQNNGTIESTLAKGSITAQSNGDLTVDGTNGTWLVSGGTGSINLKASVASLTGHQLNIGGTQTYNPGSGGSVLFDSPICSVPIGSVNISGTQLITNTPQDATLKINTPLLTFASSTALTVQNPTAATVGINVTCPSGCDLTVQSPSGGTATLTTTGSKFQIGPTDPGKNLSFTDSGASTANLLFRGGTLTTNTSAGGTQTVAANVNINANNLITMNVDNGTLNNFGIIGATTALNAPGAITVQSSVGNLTIGNLGTITVNPAGVGPGAGGTIQILDTPGTLSIASGSLDASAVGPGNFAGGTITVTAQNIGITGGNLNLSADGTGTGKGGTVNVTATSATGDISVGGASSNFNIAARGGNTGGDGGTINVSAGRTININSTGGSTFNVSPTAANGSGGDINLTASTATTTGDLTIAVDLSSNGLGTGNGGNIKLTDNGTGSINVQGKLTADSGAAGGHGGTITVRNTGGGSATSAITLTNTVSAKSVTNNGTFGTITIDSAGATGNGIINITSPTISADNIGAGGGTARGGVVSITGRNISLSGGSAHSITADGPSTGTGNGGQVTLDTSSNPASDITLTAGLGGLTMSAHSGSTGGNGGTINVTAGHNVTLASTGVVDAGVVSGTGNGGNINITGSAGAGSNGVVTVQPTLTVNGSGGGSGGSIKVINNSNAANAIVINGGTDSLLANGGTGGSILVQNNGKGGSNGGISIQGNVSATSSVLGNPASNTITVDASGNGGGPISFSTSSVKADVLAGGNGTGGTILIQGSDFTLGGTAGSISSNGAGAGNGGSITIKATGAAADVNIGAGGGAFSITANATGTGSGGSIAVTAGNDISISATAILQANAKTTGKGGSISLTASSNSTNGVISDFAPISAKGAGSGNGGSVTMINNSSTADAIYVDQAINVDAGTTGSGGTISLTNAGVAGGNGGIHLATAANLSARSSNANALASTSITVDAKGSGSNPNGVISLDSDSITVAGSGASGTGGNVLVRGEGISLTGAVVKQIDASGAPGSAGGTITFTSLGAANDISFSAGPGLILRAQGGTGAGGDGGTVNVSSGKSISLPNPGTQILVNPQGTNGNGGSINLSAGIVAAGDLIVGGSLNADGAGTGKGGKIVASLGTVGSGLFQINGTVSANGGNTGNGGTISLTYNDPTNPLHVGSTVVGQSYVSGIVTANGGAGAATTGGDITVATNANATLNVDLGNVIQAGKGPGGTLGTLTFDKAGQAVNVVGSSQLIGQVLSHGKSINIDTGAVSSVITVRDIVSTAGDVSLKVPCPTGTIEVGPNTTSLTPLVQAQGGVVNTSGEFLTMTGAGKITANLAGGTSTIKANTISMSGTSVIESTGANSTLNVQACCTSNLTVNFAGSATIRNTGTGNSDVNFNSLVNGPVTINSPGVGTISATRNVSFNGGNGSGDVLVSIAQVSGTITGTGHAFSVTTTTGNLTANGITTSTAGSNITLNAAGGAVSGTNVQGEGDISFTGGNGGVTANTVSTNNGKFTATANKTGNIVATDVSSTNTLTLQNNVTNGTITSNGKVSSSGAAVIINTTGNTASYQNNGSVSGTSVTVTTPQVTLAASASIQGTTGTVNFDSNAAGNALSVTLGNNSTVTAFGGTSINFNKNIPAGGAITVSGQGSLSAGATGTVGVNGGAGAVNINVKAIDCCVVGLGSLTGPVGAQAPIGGASVSVQVSSGNVQVGPIAASTGALSAVTTDANGNAVVCDNVFASGAVTLTSGNNGFTSVPLGKTVTGGSVQVNTPDLKVDGKIISTTGNVAVDSNKAGGALTVEMGTGSKITAATNQGINFNGNVKGGGAISVTGAGDLSAPGANGHVGVNGGAADVTINVNSVDCCVIGLGASTGPVGQQAPLGGANVSLTVATGDAKIGALAATGNVDVLTNSTTGKAVVCDNVVATGKLTMTSGNAGSTDITANKFVNAGNVQINTPTLNVNGTAQINSTVGTINIDSNAPGANPAALVVNLGNGSSINAKTGQSVNFNGGVSGGGQITVTGQGSITAGAAGHVGVNGGDDAVSINVKAIDCCVIGLGATLVGPVGQQAPLGGKSVDITVSSGNVQVGPLGSSTTLNATTTDANGKAVVCDNIAATGKITLTSGSNASTDITANKFVNGSTVQINTPALNVNGTAQINGTTGGVNVDSNGAAGALTVTMGTDSQIKGATGTFVEFNKNVGAGGAITVTGQGNLLAGAGGHVGVNGGAGAVSINVKSIDCCVIGLGAATGPVGAQAALGGSSVAVQVSSGNVQVGPLAASTGALSAVTTDANGNAVVCDNLFAGGALTLTSGSNGFTSVPLGKTVTGGSVQINTPDLKVDGNIKSTTGNVAVDSNKAGGALTVEMGTGSKITAATNQGINFNGNVKGGGAISVTGAGDLSAPGANGHVGVNGGTADVTINVNSVDCCVIGLGSNIGPIGQTAPLGGANVSLTVATGDAKIGALAATGNIDVLTNSTSGKAVVCDNVVASGKLTMTSGNAGSTDITANKFVNAGSVQINTPTLNVNGTAQINSTVGTINIDSNAPGANPAALVVNLGNGSSINAKTGQSVNFNGGVSGGGQITVTGQGSITAGAAGHVGVNGGDDAVSINVKAIDCCVIGLSATLVGPVGQQALLGGKSVDITVSSGNVQVGPLGSSTTLNATTTDANGKAVVCDNIAATGKITLTSGSNGSTDITANKFVNGSDIQINTPALNVNGTAQINASTGGVNVDSNSATGALNVTMGTDSQIKGASGTFVEFNKNVAAGGAITVTGQGNLLAGAGGHVGVNGGAGAVNINVKSIDCCVIGLGAATGPVGAQAPLGGSSVAVQVSSGNVQVGPLASTGALSAVTTDANGNAVVCDNLFAGGALTLTSGNNGFTSVPLGKTVTGGSVQVNTPDLKVDGSIKSTTGNINVDSNKAGGALTVEMGTGSKITAATNQGINFNGNVKGGGAISVTGAGDLSAPGANGHVGVNGGTADVTINVNSVDCCVIGLGSNIGPIGQTAPLGGANVSLTVATGDAKIGALAATGNIDVLTNSTSGKAVVCDNVVASGKLTMTSGNAGSTDITANKFVNAGSVQINTPTLNVNGTAQINSTVGTINIDSNAPGANPAALTVNLGNGSSINAKSGQSVNFNGGVSGGGQITVTGQGSITAGAGGHVGVNGGDDAVSINVKAIDCCVIGLGATLLGPVGQQAPLGGKSVDITVSSGNVQVGPLASSTTLNATTTDANGKAVVCDNIAATGKITLTSGSNGSTDITANKFVNGSDIQINTPALNVNGTAQINASTGGVNVDSNSATGALNVTMGTDSQIKGASGTFVEFNKNVAAGGAITVTGQGNLLAGAGGHVGVNGGAGAVNINVKSIDCCVIGLGAATGPVGAQAALGGSSVAVQVSSGNVQVGPLAASTGALSAITTDANGNAVVCDNLVAGTTLTLTSGNNGFTSVPAGKNVTGGVVQINTPDLKVDGNIKSTTGNINIDSNKAGGALTVEMGKGSKITAATDQGINFNGNVAGGGAISVTGAGDLSAPGTNGHVGVNGGTQDVTINVNSVDCCVIGLGAATGPLGQQAPLGGANVSLTVASGDAKIGALAASGNIDVLTNSTTGKAVVCDNVVAGGKLTMTSGNAGSTDITANKFVNAASVQINTPTLNVNGTAQINSTVGTINIDSNAPGANPAALTVNLGNGSSINAKSGQSVNFNGGVSGGGQITVTGQGSITAGPGGHVGVNGGDDAVSINVKAIDCCVIGLGATLLGPVGQQAPLGGKSVDITVSSGNVQVGPLASSTTLNATTTDANGKAVVCDNIAANGKITLTSGSNGSTDITANKFVNGSDIQINTPTLNVNGTAQINASTGGVNVDSNAATGTLAVNMGTDSQIKGASGTFVEFNKNVPGGGAITVSGQGKLSAGANGHVGVNGGAGAVSIDVKSIDCCVIGLGAMTGPAGQQGPLGGTTVGVKVSSGNVQLGPISSSSGNITASTTDANGNAIVCGNIAAAGDVSLTSGNNGFTSVPTNTFINGVNVQITTPDLKLNGTATVNSNGGNIAVDSNKAGAALIVEMGTGSSLNASTDKAVNFNGGVIGGGQIDITGQGSITAAGPNGSVGVNGGSNTVNIDVKTVNCCVNGLGAVDPTSGARLGGSKIDLKVSSGSTGLGDLYSPGAISVTDTDTAAGVNICKNVSGSQVTVTSPNVNFQTGATLYTTAGDVVLQSNDPVAHVLTLSFADNSGINAGNNKVNLNPTSAGKISTSTSGKGDIIAKSVGVNGGTAGVTLDVHSAECCIVGLGAVGGPASLPLGGSSVSISVVTGNTGVGPLYSPGSVSVTNNDTSSGNGNVNVCGNVNASDITLTGKGVVFTGPNTISSTTGGVTLQGNSSAGLDLTFVAGSGISAPGQAVKFNPTLAGPISTLSSGVGDINAASVGVNGGSTGDVLLNVNTISCCVSGLGAMTGGAHQAPLGGQSVSVQVSSGNVGLGAIASSTGSLSAVTLDVNGNANVCGNVIAGDKVTLTSGAKGSVTVPTATFVDGNSIAVTTPTLNLTGTASMNSTGGIINIDTVKNGTLTVNMGNGSSINGAANQPVNFNQNVPGGAQITVTGPGTISGGSVGVNGGSAAVKIDVTSVSCCVNGLGPAGPGGAPLGGSSISLTVSSGSTGIGALSSPGSISVTDADTLNGNVNICGNVTGNNVTLVTPSVTFTGPNTIATTGGDVIIQSNESKHNLTLNFAPGSGISAPGHKVNFNPQKSGPISAVGGNGDINAKSVGVNGGLSGNVVLDMNSINCCVRGLGPARPSDGGPPLGGLNVTISVQVGNVSVGPMSAVGAIKATTADPNGKVIQCGSVVPFAPEVNPVLGSSSKVNTSKQSQFSVVLDVNFPYIANGLTQNDLSNNQIYEEMVYPLADIYVCAPRKLNVKKNSQTPDLDEWILVVNDKQPFSLTSDDAFVLAEVGAEFNYSAKGMLVQRSGSLALFSGKSPVSVKVGDATFTLAANSVVLVKADGNKFNGICAKGSASFFAPDNKPVAMTELDQITGESSSQNGQKTLSVVPSKVSATVLAGSKLLKKETCCDPIQKRMIRDLRNVVGGNGASLPQPGNISSTPLLMPTADPTSPFNSIGFEQNLEAASVAGIGSVQTVLDKDFDMFAVSAAKYTVPAKQHIDLQEGEVVIDSKTNVTVTAGDLSFSLQKGTTASFIKKQNVVAVKNLSDNWTLKPSIQVKVNGRPAGSVLIGNEVIVSANSESVNRFISSDMIGRRRSNVQDLTQHKVALTNSEFSLVSYCVESPVLRHLFRTEGQAKLLFNRIMKAAVSINMATTTHGNYSSGFRIGNNKGFDPNK